MLWEVIGRKEDFSPDRRGEERCALERAGMWGGQEEGREPFRQRQEH